MLIAMLMLQATATTAGATPPPTAPKKLCRSILDTGSRLGARRICKTAAEWEQQDRSHRDFAGAMGALSESRSDQSAPR